MSSATPWSVKGIEAKAREVAKDLARRSGMTLGEWLNHMILEGHDVAAVLRDESRRERTPHRETPRYESGRRPFARPILSSQAFGGYTDEADEPDPELSRVANALEGLGSRIESSEARSANAVRGVSQAVEALLNRLERSESALAESDQRLEARLQETVSGASDRLQRSTAQAQAQLETTLSERLDTAEQRALAQNDRLDGLSVSLREERERLTRLEADVKNHPVTETVDSLDAALGKLANQLYENDTRTRDTLKGVREDMLGLSHRLSQIEQRDPERTAQTAIDKVVTRLSQRLETAEAQTSTALRSLEQAFASLDARLNRAEASGDVSDPESVQSLSRLAGDLTRRIEESRFEVIRTLEQDHRTRLDEAMSRISGRLGDVEKGSARAIEAMGQDVLKIAGNLNQRMTAVERSTQSGLSHLSHKLDERLGQAENAHAQALERLGGEIARISERLTLKISENEKRTAQVLQGVGEELDARHQRTHAEIAERIRQSEERTQKLLEEARSKIDSRLAQTRTQDLLQEALRPAETLPTPFPPEDNGPSGETRPDEPEPQVQTAPAALAEFDPFADDFEVGPARTHQPARQAPSPHDHDDPFADIDASRRASPDSLFDDIPLVPEKPAAERPAPESDAKFDEPESVSLSTRDALAAARAAVRASMEAPEDTRKPLGGLKLGQSRTRTEAQQSSKTGGNTLLRAFKASAVAVLLTVAAVGTYVLVQDRTRPVPEDVRLASALAPSLTAPPAQDEARLKAQYDVAVLSLQANDPKAPEAMKSVALLGYAPAQYHLSLIYGGEGGLVKADKAEARIWAERSAAGGYAPAMYNLGIMLYNGDGGPQDRAGAAQWFRKAAEHGVRDSYYNMGALYQQGDGVPMNLTEAYKWFSIAANAGDTEASRTLSLIKPQLTAQQIATAQSQAAAFKPAGS